MSLFVEDLRQEVAVESNFAISTRQVDSPFQPISGAPTFRPVVDPSTNYERRSRTGRRTAVSIFRGGAVVEGSEHSSQPQLLHIRRQ